MACNVFGTPVSVEALKAMPEYADKQKITRMDLAEVALTLKNAEGKDINARTYVENMSKRFEDHECVLGLIYNATGALLRYQNAYNWYGFVAPAPHPVFIENGQWGAFVFVQKDNVHGAHGSVVYRGYNFQGKEIDFFVGWDNLPGEQQSKVCVDIGAFNVFDELGSDKLSQKVVDSGQYSWTIQHQILSTAIIGSDKVAVVEVIHRPTLPSPIE